MKQPTLEELKRKAEDLETEIFFLEDEISSKQMALEEVQALMDELKDPVAYAQEQEDAAAYERQAKYLRKRYGTDLVRDIRDFWVKQ